MAHDITLSDFPSCLAGRIRAKYLRSIHLLCYCFHSHRLQIDALFFPLPRTSVHHLVESYQFAPVTMQILPCIDRLDVGIMFSFYVVIYQ
jgi:hypothetical protein